MTSSYGSINWWGFSPALDLLNLLNEYETKLEEEVNVLLVGSSDGRHILQTLASFCCSEFNSKAINIYIDESCIETLARQMLLLNLLLHTADQDMGIQEKAEFFLEIYGNSLMRKDTETQLSKQCDKIVKSITEPSLAKENYPLFDLSNLKYKERDQLDVIFKFWCSKKSVDLDTQWDDRLRQYLGARYDVRENTFDWDYNMNLKDKASIINWKEYSYWRETGVAFQLRDSSSYNITNRTLCSGLVLTRNGEKATKQGFWGDILVGPYVTFGTNSDNKILFEKHNNVHVKTATDVSFENISLISNVLSGRQDASRNTNLDLVKEIKRPFHLRNVKIVFLSLQSTNKMHQKFKNIGRFDLIYFSNSMVNFLDSSISLLFRGKDSLLVIESSKYVLDIKPEQHEEYSKKISKMGEDVNCELGKKFIAKEQDYVVFKCKGSPTF